MHRLVRTTVRGNSARPFAFLAAFALLAIGACLPAVLPHRSVNQELAFRGEARQYILHVPRSYRDGHATALIVMLHGHGERAAHFEHSTHMSDKADAEGFIVAYPQALGSPSVWHTGTDGSARVDDFAFISALIDTIARSYAIDPARVYVAGHSNGAFMAYRVGSALASRIAAVGINAGSIGRVTSRGDTLRIAAPEIPVSAIVFHGRADGSVPYDGGKEIDGPPRVIPAPRSVAFWARADGCDPSPSVTDLANGNVHRAAYRGCRDNTDVVFYTIDDGTHRWPGDGQSWWKFGIAGSNDLSATDEMWSFFATHPKAGAATR